MKQAGEKEIVVKFDDEDVPMVPFVENMLKQTLLGMMSSLKGYEEGADIEISIKEK